MRTLLISSIVLILSACVGGRQEGLELPVVVGDGGVASELEDAGSAEGVTELGACTSSADCDDGLACTEDQCRFSSRCPSSDPECVGYCVHRPVPARCAAGETCDPRHGCLPGRACNSDDMCESTLACYVSEGCDPAARVCVIVPLDGDDDGNRPRVCGGTDCDDSREDVFQGARELCDGLDNDCDGTVDEEPSSGSCGPGTCVEGACICDEGFSACGEDGCLDLETDSDNCGRCGRGCREGNVCSGGACVSCGGPGEPCCEPDDSCEDDTLTCASGTCELRECGQPPAALEARALPRCSSATYDCIARGGDSASCLDADRTRARDGVDCRACADNQMVSCAGTRCPSQFAYANCCLADRCPPGSDSDCAERECHFALDLLWSCADACRYIDRQPVRACFP